MTDSAAGLVESVIENVRRRWDLVVGWNFSVHPQYLPLVLPHACHVSKASWWARRIVGFGYGNDQ